MTDTSPLGITAEEIEALLSPVELEAVSGEWITSLGALQYIEKTCFVARRDAIKSLCLRAFIAIPVKCITWTIEENPHEYINRFDYFQNIKRKYDHFERKLCRNSFGEMLHFFEALGEGESSEGDWLIEHALWETGDFKVHLERDFSVVRLAIVGLQFDRLALENAFTGRIESAGSIAAGESRKSGGRPLSSAWPIWIAELVHYIHEVGYPAGEGAQGQETIINAVADRLAKRGAPCPSRSTVQAAVQATMDRFRAKG